MDVGIPKPSDCISFRRAVLAAPMRAGDWAPVLGLCALSALAGAAVGAWGTARVATQRPHEPAGPATAAQPANPPEPEAEPEAEVEAEAETSPHTPNCPESFGLLQLSSAQLDELLGQDRSVCGVCVCAVCVSPNPRLPGFRQTEHEHFHGSSLCRLVGQQGAGEGGRNRLSSAAGCRLCRQTERRLGLPCSS